MWSSIQSQASNAASTSSVLEEYFAKTVTRHSTLPDALASALAGKLASNDVPRDLLEQELAALLAEPDVCAAVVRDLDAVVEADPAAPDLLTVMLHFKGFSAIAAHRAAHTLWARGPDDAGSRHLALLLQGRASEIFGVDIHPGARIGAGVFIDHATGIVIGEQAAVGDDCYILHGVTLGATGKRDKTGRRHPLVGSGCTIGSGASVLGPITVGDGATVGANAVVTKNVEAGATVIDTAFMNNRVLAPKKPKV